MLRTCHAAWGSIRIVRQQLTLLICRLLRKRRRRKDLSLCLEAGAAVEAEAAPMATGTTLKKQVLRATTNRCHWFRPVSRGGCDNRACLLLWIPMSLTAGVRSSPKQALVVHWLLTPICILAVSLRHRFPTLSLLLNSFVLTTAFHRSALGGSPLPPLLSEVMRLRSWEMVCYPSVPGPLRPFPMIGPPFLTPMNMFLSSAASNHLSRRLASTTFSWMAPSFHPLVSGPGLSPLCFEQLKVATFDGALLGRSWRIARARFMLRPRLLLMCLIGWSQVSLTRPGRCSFTEIRPLSDLELTAPKALQKVWTALELWFASFTVWLSPPCRQLALDTWKPTLGKLTTRLSTALQGLSQRKVGPLFAMSLMPCVGWKFISFPGHGFWSKTTSLGLPRFLNLMIWLLDSVCLEFHNCQWTPLPINPKFVLVVPRLHLPSWNSEQLTLDPLKKGHQVMGSPANSTCLAPRWRIMATISWLFGRRGPR